MTKFLESLTKFTSRKFLTALAAQIGAIVSLFATPSSGDVIADAIVKVGSLLALVLAALGYGVIEARMDREALRYIAFTPEESAAAPGAPPDPPAAEDKVAA